MHWENKRFTSLALLQFSVYCSSLKLKLQYLQGIPVLENLPDSKVVSCISQYDFESKSQNLLHETYWISKDIFIFSFFKLTVALTGKKYHFLSLLLLLLLSRFSHVRLCATPQMAAHQAPIPGILQARTLEWAAIPSLLLSLITVYLKIFQSL